MAKRRTANMEPPAGSAVGHGVRRISSAVLLLALLDEPFSRAQEHQEDGPVHPVAIGLLSAIGDITRFPTPAGLSSYFGLTPSTYQSGDTCYHGRLTKRGRSHARWLAIEAAQAIANSSVPLAVA